MDVDPGDLLERIRTEFPYQYELSYHRALTDLLRGENARLQAENGRLRAELVASRPDARAADTVILEGGIVR